MYNRSAGGLLLPTSPSDEKGGGGEEGNRKGEREGEGKEEEGREENVRVTGRLRSLGTEREIQGRGEGPTRGMRATAQS